MSLTINTNINSLIIQGIINNNQRNLDKTIERISTGLQINSASDDPAGLAISTKMQTQISGMNVAKQNTSAATSMLQTGDNSLGIITNIFSQMRDLAVQSSNSTLTSGDRNSLNEVYQQLYSQYKNITKNTTYNSINVIDNQQNISFQIGANSKDVLSIQTSNSSNYLANNTDLTNESNSTNAIALIDTALNSVTKDRANYGAYLNRLSSISTSLSNSITNLTTSKGRITDTDIAKESLNLAKQQIQQQVGLAMLAQANQIPGNVLTLLK